MPRSSQHAARPTNPGDSSAPQGNAEPDSAGESWWLFRNDPSATEAAGAKARRESKKTASGQFWPAAPPWRRFQTLPTTAGTAQQPTNTAEAAAPPETLDKNKDYGMGQKYWEDLDKIAQASSVSSSGVYSRGQTFRLPRDQNNQPTDKAERILLAVNAAIRLRRPLLVTGLPGSGKTSLAYAIAAELGLGPVLVWPITPRSRLLEDGLYRYDALARLQQADLDRSSHLRMMNDRDSPLDSTPTQEKPAAPPIDQFIRLGPVGTAFLPSRWPRVLLIDEIDKGDLQLPNELLHLFEEGRYEIAELTRAQRSDSKGLLEKPYEIRTADAKLSSDGMAGMEEPLTVDLRSGFVSCGEFPIVVMTSNREREFPPAFHRRCIRIGMPPPDEQVLTPIFEAHFAKESPANQPKGKALREEINIFLGLDLQQAAAADGEPTGAGPASIRDRAVDQLLNALFLLTGQSQDGPDEGQRKALREILYRNLSDPSEEPESSGSAADGQTPAE
ncbi:MAG: ATPase [Cyanobacteriota bacterium]